MYIRQMCKIIFLCTVACLEKQKLTFVGFKPSTSLIVSRFLNHFASRRIDVTRHTNKVNVYCSTWRLVTYVQRRTSRPTRPGHDVARPSLHVIWNPDTSDKSDVKSISKYIQVYSGIYWIYCHILVYTSIYKYHNSYTGIYCHLRLLHFACRGTLS